MVSSDRPPACPDAQSFILFRDRHSVRHERPSLQKPAGCGRIENSLQSSLLDEKDPFRSASLLFIIVLALRIVQFEL
jgi:hypothetical protein